MTEYRYVPLDYYFVTSRENDKLILDSLDGFERTGQSFSVLARHELGSHALSRYFFSEIAKAGTRGSHFYTLFEGEKRGLLLLNTANVLLPRVPYDEAIEAFVFSPVVVNNAQVCGDGLVPVYRLFRGNIRFPDDPNHRFTASKLVYDDFVGRGWDGEGIAMCVPPAP